MLAGIRSGTLGVMRSDWGILDVCPTDRTGWVIRHELIVYPPGTNAAERRAYRFWHLWPAVGVIVAVAAMGLSSVVVPDAWCLAVAAVIYLAGFAVALGPTRRVRRGLHRRVAYSGHFTEGRSTRGDIVTLERAALDLIDLDRARERGECDPVHYELAWADAWRELAADRGRPAAAPARG